MPGVVSVPLEDVSQPLSPRPKLMLPLAAVSPRRHSSVVSPPRYPQSARELPTLDAAVAWPARISPRRVTPNPDTAKCAQRGLSAQPASTSVWRRPRVASPQRGILQCYSASKLNRVPSPTCFERPIQLSACERPRRASRVLVSSGCAAKRTGSPPPAHLTGPAALTQIEKRIGSPLIVQTEAGNSKGAALCRVPSTLKPEASRASPPRTRSRSLAREAGIAAKLVNAATLRAEVTPPRVRALTPQTNRTVRSPCPNGAHSGQAAIGQTSRRASTQGDNSDVTSASVRMDARRVTRVPTPLVKATRTKPNIDITMQELEAKRMEVRAIREKTAKQIVERLRHSEHRRHAACASDME